MNVPPKERRARAGAFGAVVIELARRLLEPDLTRVELRRATTARLVYVGVIGAIAIAIAWRGKGIDIDHAYGALPIGAAAGGVAVLSALYAAYIFGGARRRPETAGAPRPPERPSQSESTPGHEGDAHDAGWRPSLSGVDLSDTDLEGADLERYDLGDARLDRARLSRARLSGAVLRGARLDDAILVGATVENADLRGARLDGADLREARLAGARLEGAKARGATLRHVKLTDASLVKADLSGADLSGADLAGADLSGAKLQDATMTAVKADARTIWPGTYRPPDGKA